MAELTRFLQAEFQKHCPAGWQAEGESRFLSGEMERLLGYAPRADVLLSRKDGSRRLWVEFEVSRADPVANHAKFATGHLFSPFPRTDSFVSMVSSHVEKGRRNLAANTIYLMRKVGINAFQMPLFPLVAPEDIKRLNHSDLGTIGNAQLNVGEEIDRCLTLPEPILSVNKHRIFHASNVLEVLLNVERWNHEVQTADGRHLWGRRRCQYFVYSPSSGLFAPSKFCAFTSSEYAVPIIGQNSDAVPGFMTIDLYASLDETETRFDGRIAWQHLAKNLGFTCIQASGGHPLVADFRAWYAKDSGALFVAEDAVLLCPPDWY